MRRRLAVATAAALAITALAACGSDDSGSAAESIPGLTVEGDVGEKPELTLDNLDVEDVETAVLVEGDGEEVPAESTVMLHSLFAVGGSGDELSSSYEGEEPQTVVLGQTQDFIQEALAGSAVGSRIAFALPAVDYFGDEPQEGSGVTADDDIVIVLDVMGVDDPPLDGPQGTDVDPPADAPTVVAENGDVTALDFSDAPRKAPGKLQVIPLVEGDGAKIGKGDQVTVDYFGVVWGKGDKPFDESYSRQPAAFSLAEGSLIDGWVQGLRGQTVGSRVMLVIPPDLAYGDQEQGSIPADSTLVFVVDILGSA